MKIGFAAPIEMADSLAEAGYDFIEPLIAGFGMTDAASLEAAKQLVSRACLPTLSFGQFFTPDVRLVGPESDASSVKSYLGRVAELMAYANADVAVMGSASARNVPDDFERTQAEDQLLEAYSWAAEAFHGSGTTIAIEPQNRNETNIINSLPEAVSFAQRVNRPELRVAADSYHMDEEQEPLQHLSTFAEWIVHVQLADTGRGRPGSGSFDYGTFFGHLKQSRYPGHLSIEIPDKPAVPELRDSYQFLQRCWQE
jgi:sugar phosphate isomerase/epimerase